MTFASALAFAFAATLAQGPVAATSSDDLAVAKTLYASASYEEALTHLSTIEGSANREQVEQYRALCLLALGRTAEAEQSLEKIVTAKPLFTITDTDVSPRLVAMFHDVRKRLLPGEARDIYTQAKASFDAKDYTVASAKFKDLLAILADADVAGQAAGLADLKQLADGFMKLSDAAIAATPKTPPPAPAPPPPAPTTPAPAPAAPTVYSASDKDVTPPVDIDRKLPPWNPPNAIAARTTRRGLLEVDIDEQGNVESVTMRVSASKFYDDDLVAAAKKWRFQPATRNGVPVKYRRFFDISLAPNNF